ncbi:MAG: DDE-type integrase/transposase/recombinase [Proteobacteria bacterium]|nr:DDE-type integrase/transposase/recombinase [Pseudomonadota bacterium]
MQDTSFVGIFKDIGHVYQQTFMDTYARVVLIKLYTEKTAATAADFLTGCILFFFEEQGIPLLRLLTDHDTAYSGQGGNHIFQLYIALANIDHYITKDSDLQVSKIFKSFYKTLKTEFYGIALKEKKFSSLEELQKDLDLWLFAYNEVWPN